MFSGSTLELAMGVCILLGAVIGFLSGILMMMCLNSNKKKDDKTAPKPDQNMMCMVTHGGYHDSHTYHTRMCRSMFGEPDSAGNKVQHDFVQLELCKNCRYLEQIAVRRTKGE